VRQRINKVNEINKSIQTQDAEAGVLRRGTGVTPQQVAM
tara:strand:- start:383 stop:499 length:117 start_codon:yes stop_codon:yes gene_type:complete